MRFPVLPVRTQSYRPILVALGLSWAAISTGCGSDSVAPGGTGGVAGGSGEAGEAGVAGTDVSPPEGGSAGALEEAAGAAGAAGADDGVDPSVTAPPYLLPLAQSSFFVGMTSVRPTTRSLPSRLRP